jgi:hypothetical protein
MRLLLMLLIGVNILVIILGALWLYADQVRHRARVTGRRWHAQELIRIPAAVAGALLLSVAVAFVASWLGAFMGFPRSAAWGLRVAAALTASIWLVLAGSAAENAALGAGWPIPGASGFARLDAWSQRWLGSWQALRVLLGVGCGVMAPVIGLTVVPMVLLAKIHVPVLRAALGLPPVPEGARRAHP